MSDFNMTTVPLRMLRLSAKEKKQVESRTYRRRLVEGGTNPPIVEVKKRPGGGEEITLPVYKADIDKLLTGKLVGDTAVQALSSILNRSIASSGVLVLGPDAIRQIRRCLSNSRIPPHVQAAMVPRPTFDFITFHKQFRYVDVSELEKVVVPINQASLDSDRFSHHWYNIEINIAQKCFTIHDSLFRLTEEDAASRECIRNLRSWLEIFLAKDSMYDQGLTHEHVRALDIASWSVKPFGRQSPSQTNVCSSGIFSMLSCIAICLGRQQNFCQKDVKDARFCIASCILSASIKKFK